MNLDIVSWWVDRPEQSHSPRTLDRTKVYPMGVACFCWLVSAGAVAHWCNSACMITYTGPLALQNTYCLDLRRHQVPDACRAPKAMTLLQHSAFSPLRSPARLLLPHNNLVRLSPVLSLPASSWLFYKNHPQRLWKDTFKFKKAYHFSPAFQGYWTFCDNILVTLWAVNSEGKRGAYVIDWSPFSLHTVPHPRPHPSLASPAYWVAPPHPTCHARPSFACPLVLSVFHRRSTTASCKWRAGSESWVVYLILRKGMPRKMVVDAAGIIVEYSKAACLTLMTTTSDRFLLVQYRLAHHCWTPTYHKSSNNGSPSI